MLPTEIRRKIRSIEIRTSRMVSDVLAGQYRSAFKGRGMEFEEVRPYMYGDDVRSIDWNVSARVGEPHVKVFREERELTVMLAVDLSGSLAFGTRAQLKRELVAEIDAFWLSFSLLTTTGFAELAPAGRWGYTAAMLEAVCGVLFPATLIARIASLPAPDPGAGGQRAT